MRYLQTVWASLAACSLILLPYLASGQQDHQPQWQGGSPPASFLQSRPPADSSQKPAPNPGQSPSVDHRQLPPAGAEQAVQQEIQPSAPPGSQDTEELTAQKEIPPTWPPTTPPTVSLAGYLGANTRDFYRERLCLHAMTIKAVEVTSVDPGSPAERAGLRAAKAMTGREVITATVAGLLVLSPAAPLAAHVLRAAGGVDHGDLILAVGGKRVTTRNEFERALSGFGPQTVVYLTVRRGDTISQVPVRLEQGPTPDLSASLQQTRLQ
jgi:hypothetical protein